MIKYEDSHEPYVEACGNAIVARGIQVNALETRAATIRAGVLHLGDPNEAPGDQVFHWDEERGWAYGMCVPGRDPLDVLDGMVWIGDQVLPTPQQVAELIATIVTGKRFDASLVGPAYRRAGDDRFDNALAAYATALEVPA